MTKEECKGIWVFAEQENGVLSGTDFELLAKAHDLKEKLEAVKKSWLHSRDGGDYEW